ncbi:hypothetical protein [Luteolibacter sp. Populi]|uniref:hypothetical protein n=1 Tax=Luteolibacter sp. Populi TaxID=3230487 RepID=UPI003466B578
MSEIPGAWFHCRHCGALFKAADADKRGDCPACGHDPVTGGEGAPDDGSPEAVRVRRKVRRPGASRQHQHQSRHRSREGKKKARMLMFLVAGWVILVGIGAVLLKRKWPDVPPAPSADYVEKDVGLSKDDQQFLEDHSEACADCMSGFLSTSDVAARSRHVLRAEQTVARMARYYSQNPEVPAGTQLELVMRNLIHTPAGPAVEMMWKKGEGDFLESVFFQENGEWKLDWEAYVRAGSESWGLFLIGTEAGEGEFRVLARERLGAEGQSGASIGLVLSFPRPGHPGEVVSSSPEIRVTRATALGRAIEEAFAARAENRGAFGSKMSTFDPAGMVRLRVRVKRSGEEERSFEIEELLAPHWLELPGMPVKAGE